MTRGLERIWKRCPFEWLFLSLYASLAPPKAVIRTIEDFWTKVLPRVQVVGKLLTARHLGRNLEDCGNSLPATYAHRLKSITALASAQFVQHRSQYTDPRCGNRMTQRNAGAIDV